MTVKKSIPLKAGKRLKFTAGHKLYLLTGVDLGAFDTDAKEAWKALRDDLLTESIAVSPSMRRPVSVKSFLSFFPLFFLLLCFFFFQVVPIEPSRLCRHPSIRTLW